MTPLPDADGSAAFQAAVTLFDAGKYLAAHELFEELWEATEGEDADFYKGLIQAAIALHHFEAGNLEGAAKLYTGHRGALARYVPSHAGVDVTRFLTEMRRVLLPVIERRAGESVRFPRDARPRLGAST